jgi:integrase
VCGCLRRQWPKCAHAWYFSFQWKGVHYRFSLDKQIGTRVESKTEAETEAEKFRIQIREGTFQRETPVPAPDAKAMTVQALMSLYAERVVVTRSQAAIDAYTLQRDLICRTVVPCPVGPPQPLGDWKIADVSADVLEQFRDIRKQTGKVGANRCLSTLQACFSWAASRKRGYIPESPFRDGDRAAIERFPEEARTRRLEPGEDLALFAECGPDLRAIVEAALETGCRRGELLSLQWSQVRLDGKSELFLPAEKPKPARTARFRSLND